MCKHTVLRNKPDTLILSNSRAFTYNCIRIFGYRCIRTKRIFCYDCRDEFTDSLGWASFHSHLIILGEYLPWLCHGCGESIMMIRGIANCKLCWQKFISVSEKLRSNGRDPDKVTGFVYNHLYDSVFLLKDN